MRMYFNVSTAPSKCTLCIKFIHFKVMWTQPEVVIQTLKKRTEHKEFPQHIHFLCNQTTGFSALSSPPSVKRTPSIELNTEADKRILPQVSQEGVRSGV